MKVTITGKGFVWEVFTDSRDKAAEVIRRVAERNIEATVTIERTKE